MCNIEIAQTLLQTNQEASTLNFLFKNSNLLEREIWELFGIKFKLNLNLGRLLLDYNFEGYPFRKDFDLWGMLSIKYFISNDNLNVSQHLSIAQ